MDFQYSFFLRTLLLFILLSNCFVVKSDTKMGSKIKIKMPNGHSMPALGFGTWLVPEENVESSIDAALEAGYRHFDCAPIYKNEKAIGKTLKKWLDSGKVKREDLFIVTKLPPGGNRPRTVEKYLNKSLKDLQLDYVDLYLIHLPVSFLEVEGDPAPFNVNGEIKLDMTTNHLAIWAEMETQVAAKRTRAIGLANFNASQITKIFKIAKVPISNLEIEMHVYLQQKELIEFCNARNITVTAHTPLGGRDTVRMIGKTNILSDMLKDPVVQQIAKKRGKSPAQILLRHHLQRGVVAIPKSLKPKRIKENMDVFDFQLTANEMEKLNKLNKGPKSRVWDLVSLFNGINKHPEFPFTLQ